RSMHADQGTAEAPEPPLPVIPEAAPEVGRAPLPSAGLGAPIVSPPLQPSRASASTAPMVPTATDSRRSETYYEVKGAIFGALIEAIDLAQLARLDAESAR